MSAWLCPEPHIDAIVQQLGYEKIITGHMADDIGRQLIYENMLSLTARYGSSEPRPPRDPGDIDYTFTGIEAVLDIRCVLVACRSWMYQTCEYEMADSMPGWKLVAELIEILANDLEIDDGDDPLAVLPMTLRSAAWCVEDLTHIIQGANQ